MAPPLPCSFMGRPDSPRPMGGPPSWGTPQAKLSVVSPPLDKGLYSWLRTSGRG
jgi:hypothetical protein